MEKGAGPCLKKTRNRPCFDVIIQAKNRSISGRKQKKIFSSNPKPNIPPTMPRMIFVRVLSDTSRMPEGDGPHSILSRESAMRCS